MDTKDQLKYLSWPIGIILTMVGFMAFMIATLLFSRTVPVNLVSDQYYQQAVDYQGQLDGELRARTAGHELTFEYDAAREQIFFSFGNFSEERPELHLHFFRPSDSRADFRIVLPADGSSYRGFDASGMQTGLWRIQVSYNLASGVHYHEVQFVK